MAEQFAGKLRFAPETVDDPPLSRTHLFFQTYDLGISSDYMKDERATQCLAQRHMSAEQEHLRFHCLRTVSAGAGGIETALADGYNRRRGRKRAQKPQGPFGCTEHIPGMNPHGIHVAFEKNRADHSRSGQNNGVDVNNRIAPQGVCMSVDIH